MKKLLLLLLAGVTYTSASAQINVPTDHNTMVFKATADWCPPCGTWGWSTMKTVVDDAKAGSLNAIGVAMHGSSSTTPALNVMSGVLSAIRSNLDADYTGIPSFLVGGKNLNQANNATISSEVGGQTSGAAVANAGFMATFDKTKKEISVDTKVKFFANATGDYYLAVYAYEDEITAYQASIGASAVHDHVWRVDGATPWGTKIAAGPYTSTSEFTSNVVLKTGSWNMDKLHVFTAIWKKNGTKYELVNANKVGSFPTSVAEVSNVANLRVYPNPATSNIQVAGILKSANTATISLTNVVGQVVYNETFNTGANLNKSISVSNIANGVYMLNVTVDGISSTEKVLINK